MALIWKMEKAFMKDIIEAYSNPKPAPTSIATLLKRLYNKKFIDNKVYGNSREYFPLVDKENYLNIEITKLIN
ncbi:Penicillinase repressor [Cruoricaptor ignavus]|uniref:Penicillinase repressor n=2 Tax=Cruoricaptor ignavus TaxID=1118202 RepID=A0A1M6HQA7_9FLAO|nr:Penicillinase repressor [Cruoricaptor ignavus]